MAAESPIPPNLAAARVPRSLARRDALLSTLVLAVILVIAAVLRAYALGNQSLWSDEGNSAALASRSLLQIARDTANDIHPPLYYWLLHIWTRIVGTSEIGLRSLSALLGILLVLATAELGRCLGGRATGLAAAFIAALAPFQVYYSQEARMYMLLALEGAVAALLFWWYIRQEAARLPAPSASSVPSVASVSSVSGSHLRRLPFSGQMIVLAWAAGLYTHYAFPLLIALLSLFYAAWLIASWRRRQVGRRLLRWGLLLVLTLGLYAPWLPVALRQLTAWPRPDQPVEPLAALGAMVKVLSLGPTGGVDISSLWLWLMPALALIGALPWRSGRQAPGWLSWLLPVAWAVAPLAMIVGLGLFRDAYLKFLLIASPAWCILLARGVLGPAGGLSGQPPTGQAASRWSNALALLRGIGSAAWVIGALAAVGGLSGPTLARYYTDPALARDDYRSIAQFVAATAAPGDGILLTAPGQAEVFRYYYRGDLPIYPLPRTRPLDPAATRDELNLLLGHGKVYAVYWANAEADPQGLIEGWLNSRGYKTLDQWHGNVRLAVYVMPERRAADETVTGANVYLGPDIMLLGYRGWNLAPTAGQVTQLQLTWRAERPVARRYKVFLQLLDARDQVIAQRDSEPAGDSRPTDGWQPGEVISDNHGLLIPPGTPPGSYRRIIGLYDRETGARLRLSDGNDFLSLPPVTVARAAVPPPLAALGMQNTQSFEFGGISLLGHDRYRRGFRHAPQTPLAPGDLLHLTFYWQAKMAPRADWWFNLTLNDAQGRTVARLSAPLVGDTYATTRWAKGEVVRGEHDLLLPADLRPDTYRLTLELLPDAETPAGTAYLGTVEVVEKGNK